MGLLALLLAGCATTSRIDWKSRLGIYTYEQAILEFGPPDKNAKLSDGTVVAEWLTRRGYTQAYASPSYGFYPGYYGSFGYVDTFTYPDAFLRLVFDPEGRLREHRKFYR